MRCLLLTLCGLCPLGFVHAAVADDSSELTGRVSRLVRQLDDDLRSRRDAAERELISLGPEILDLLPAESTRLSDEQRGRLQKIRNTLEVAVAESTTQVSLVTLSGEMTLAEAFSAIEVQTGNQIGGYRDREGSVDVAFDETPFWPAMDQLLDQAKLDLVDTSEFGLSVAARPAEQRQRTGAGSYDGVLRFELLQVSAIRSLRTPYINTLQVRLRIEWEPRVSVVSVGLPTAEVTATTDRGETLAEARRATLGAEVDGLNMVDLTLPLRLPSRDARQVKKLAGQIDATILGRKQQFTFSRLDAKDQQQSKAGATVTFQQMRKNQQLYEVRMRVRFDDAGDSLASHRDWISRNKAYMVDAMGETVQPAAEEFFLQGESQIGRAYLFDLEKGPDDYRFVYETPGAVVRKSFQFEFEDIDLP